MRMITRIAAGAVILGTAAWSGLWFAGRGAVAERLDAEIAGLRAQGYQIDYTAREIGGFPFGYRVTHREVTFRQPGVGQAQGPAYLLPEVTTAVTAADVTRLVTYLPPKYRIEAPIPKASREASPGLPDVIGIDVESQNLVLVSDGLPGVDQAISVTADNVLMVSAAPGQTLNLALEFKGLSVDVTLPPRSGAMPSTSRMNIDQVDYAYANVGTDGTSFALKGSVDAVRATGNSDMGWQGDMLAKLESGTGASSAAYQTGASSGELTTGGGSGPPGPGLTFSAASTAGTATLANGRIEFNAASQANRVAWVIPAGKDGKMAVTYGAEMRAVEMLYGLPIAPSAELAPASLRLALDQVAPDAALWLLLDSAGKLPRDPVRLVIDIEGTARVTTPLSEVRPGDASPFELGRVTVKAADLTGLGAGLTTRGEMAFQRPSQVPVGKLKVTLTRAKELLNSLTAAGLIDAMSAQTAIVMANAYTIPGAAEGERVAEIEIGADGIKVNGQRVGGL